jgi:hypothetical protein
MPDVDRRLLIGHTAARSTDPGGGCLVFFGLPFLAVGGFVIALSLGYIPLNGRSNAPMWVLTSFGSVFALAGLFVSSLGYVGWARGRSAARRREEHPLEPWLWDFPFDTTKATHGSLGRAVGGFVGFGFFCIFLAGFHFWAFFTGEGPLPVKIFVVLMDFVALLILWGAFHSLFAYLKYGKSRLHFARFPFRPGNSIEAGLEVNSRIRDAQKIELALRYIEEIVITRGSGKNSNTQINLYCLHEVLQTITPAQYGSTDGEIPISMRLPSGDYSTRLLEKPRRYWELEVKAETPGIDYQAAFLLPVYGAQGAAPLPED